MRTIKLKVAHDAHNKVDYYTAFTILGMDRCPFYEDPTEYEGETVVDIYSAVLDTECRHEDKIKYDYYIIVTKDIFEDESVYPVAVPKYYDFKVEERISPDGDKLIDVYLFKPFWEDHIESFTFDMSEYNTDDDTAIEITLDAIMDEITEDAGYIDPTMYMDILDKIRSNF